MRSSGSRSHIGDWPEAAVEAFGMEFSKSLWYFWYLGSSSTTADCEGVNKVGSTTTGAMSSEKQSAGGTSSTQTRKKAEVIPLFQAVLFFL